MSLGNRCVCLCSRWNAALLQTQSHLIVFNVVLPRRAGDALHSWRDCEKARQLAVFSNWHFSDPFLTHAAFFFLSSDLISCHLSLCSDMCGWPAHIPWTHLLSSSVPSLDSCFERKTFQTMDCKKEFIKTKMLFKWRWKKSDLREMMRV